MAVLTLLVLGFVAGPIDAPLLPDIRLAPEHWAVLAGVPVAAGLIAMVTAGITVRRTLARML
jgi:cell division transport system permease protein